MKVCVQCGSENEPRETVCSTCGASLPKMHIKETVETLEPDSITGRLDQFKQAAERVKNGEWKPEEFAAFLENISQVLSEISQNYIQLIEESGYYEWASNEVDLSMEGMEDYEIGISHFWAFIDDGDFSHLDEGLETMRGGNNKIIEAMKLNREFRKSLAEKLEFLL